VSIHFLYNRNFSDKILNSEHQIGLLNTLSVFDGSGFPVGFQFPAQRIQPDSQKPGCFGLVSPGLVVSTENIFLFHPGQGHNGFGKGVVFTGYGRFCP
jgi:hypothetical protein